LKEIPFHEVQMQSTSLNVRWSQTELRVICILIIKPTRCSNFSNLFLE